MKYEHTTDVNIKRHTKSKIYYYVRGRVEHSLKTKKWEEAVERKQLRVDAIESLGSSAFRIKVANLYPLYILAKRDERDGKVEHKRPIRPGTFDEIGYIFGAHLLPFFGNMKLAHVTTHVWSQYVKVAKVADLTNHRKVMYGFLKWAKREGHLKAISDLSELSYHVRRPRKVIKPKQLESIFDHAIGSLKLFLALALYNGMRRKEIMTLKWSAVNLEFRYVRVAKEHNKLGRARSIPINAVLVHLLKQRQDEQLDAKLKTPWVFPNRDDRKRHASMSGLKGSWKRVLEKAGLAGEFTWHDFRATFETHSHKSTEYTDMQREKFADSTKEIQSLLYVDMDHDDLRGLEDSVKLPEVARRILRTGNKAGPNE